MSRKFTYNNFIVPNSKVSFSRSNNEKKIFLGKYKRVKQDQRLLRELRLCGRNSRMKGQLEKVLKLFN